MMTFGHINVALDTSVFNVGLGFRPYGSDLYSVYRFILLYVGLWDEMAEGIEKKRIKTNNRRDD